MKRHLGANKMYNPLIKQIMNLFGNKETNQKSFDDGIEQIKADYAALKEEIVIKEEKIIEQQKIIEALREQLEKGNPDTTTPIVTVEETPAHKEEVTIQMPDYAPALEAIGNNVAALKAQADEIKMLVERREALDENMRAMHKELEQFRGDFYAKITQPHLLAMLDLHKRFFDTHAHFDHLDNTEADMQQLYNNLMNEFMSAINALSNRIYNDFGVEYYEPKENDEFNPREQQPINVVETDDPEKHRKIAKVIYGGFRNIDTGKILRPARIACYKASTVTE